MNRRAAIAAILTGAPMASAYMPIEPWKPGAKTYAIIGQDGRMEVLLDNLHCVRVTFGGESIDISAAELFEALKPRAEVPKWNPHATITDRPAGMKP